GRAGEERFQDAPLAGRLPAADGRHRRREHATARRPASLPMTEPRISQVTRNTAETQITVRVNLDGTGQAKLATGIGFFDHMLDPIARPGLIDLGIEARGDLHIV